MNHHYFVFQMDIKQLKQQRGSQPFQKTLTVKICGLSDIIKYTSATGEKELVTLGLADRSDSIKGKIL
ncbi:MAG: hypothetical protein ABW185_02640 [Sedimenticola sp.]